MITKERLEKHLKALIELDSKDYDLVYLGTPLDSALSDSRVLVKFLIDNWDVGYDCHDISFGYIFEDLQRSNKQ